jgi:hypothetical protein
MGFFSKLWSVVTGVPEVVEDVAELTVDTAKLGVGIADDVAEIAAIVTDDPKVDYTAGVIDIVDDIINSEEEVVVVIKKETEAEHKIFDQEDPDKPKVATIWSDLVPSPEDEVPKVATIWSDTVSAPEVDVSDEELGKYEDTAQKTSVKYDPRRG